MLFCVTVNGHEASVNTVGVVQLSFAGGPTWLTVGSVGDVRRIYSFHFSPN
jgi:hypothetical protein